MIQNIENFHPELGIKVLGNSFDVVVLEEREIKVHQARPNDDIATGVASQIKTRWKSVTGVAVRGVKSGCRGRRDREALCLDVIFDIPWVNQGRTVTASYAIRVVI